MKKYAVVIERGPNDLSAYVPDLPGCISTGKDLVEIERNIRDAIELHLEGLPEDGDPAPEPSTVTLEVEVRTAAWPASSIRPRQRFAPDIYLVLKGYSKRSCRITDSLGGNQTPSNWTSSNSAAALRDNS